MIILENGEKGIKQIQIRKTISSLSGMIDSREYSAFDSNLKRVEEKRLDWKMKDICKETRARTGAE